MHRLRIIARVVCAVAGVGLIHYAFMRDQAGAGFYGISVLALAGALSGPTAMRLGLIGLAVAALVGARQYGNLETNPYLLLAAPVFFNLSAVLLFGHTLLPGQVPLITRFSRFDRRQTESRAVDRHTRALTAIWTGYFAAIVIATILLAAAGAFLAASWVVTIISPAGAAALFLLEHLYRYLRRDLFGQASVLRTMRLIAQPDAWRGRTHDA